MHVSNSKSDKTSFIGTHCSTICWETVRAQFLAHPVDL